MALVQFGGDQKGRGPLKTTELYRWTARETRWKRYVVSRESPVTLAELGEEWNAYRAKSLRSQRLEDVGRWQSRVFCSLPRRGMLGRKKRTNFETVQLEIVRINFDDIWQEYSKSSRIEYVCFSFRVGLHFLSPFRLSSWTPKVTRILTLCQANATTLTKC